MSLPIKATFKDEFTGEMIVRQLCMMSEFFASSLERQMIALQEWADVRGNQQHDSLLTAQGWE